MFASCKRYFKRQSKVTWLIILGPLVALAFNEFLIYYIVIAGCSWPVLVEENALRTMVLADTHLLGPFRGHWLDKLRREWQMYRAFVTAQTLHKPDAVIFLGDLFDEGKWVDEAGFASYVQRFHSLFPTATGKPHHVVVGNHDIGFHYAIYPDKLRMFEKSFGKPPVSWDTIKNTHFLSINSMAMEGDGCRLCNRAIKRLNALSGDIECMKNSCSRNVSYLKPYSRPILLQHFPLYRQSDASCVGEDAAPEDEKNTVFRENWDCLSKEASEMLLSKFEPRLVLSGHTHHGCTYRHGNTVEISVPSFSWRNRNNPSFLMVTFGVEEFRVAKCMTPMESTVFFSYTCMGIVYVLLLITAVRKRFYSKSLKKSF